MNKSRRSFLGIAGATAGATVLGATTSRAQASAVTLKLATSWPKGFPIFEFAATHFANRVEALSGGSLRVHIDSANKHKAPFEVFDFVQQGIYDMGHTAGYYWKSVDPVMSVLTTTPFGMNVAEQNAWFWGGDGMALMQEAYGKYNLLSFNAGNTGVQMGGWFRKEIKTIADLQGLKMRVPGLAGEVYAAVGAVPVTIPGGELYTALERNTIDALEWVGPHLDVKMGFHQVADFYYTGWHEPAAELQYLVNQEKWKSLSEAHRAVLKTAMNESSFLMMAEATQLNAQTWQDLEKDAPNVQIRSFPPDVVEALKHATNVKLQELAATSELAARIVKSQQEFLALVKPWTNLHVLR